MFIYFYLFIYLRFWHPTELVVRLSVLASSTECDVKMVIVVGATRCEQPRSISSLYPIQIEMF